MGVGWGLGQRERTRFRPMCAAYHAGGGPSFASEERWKPAFDGLHALPSSETAIWIFLNFHYIFVKTHNIVHWKAIDDSFSEHFSP